MSKPDPLVDDFARQTELWQAEVQALRSILRVSGLTEELKWRKPCYTLDGANVAIIQPFKKFCALMFFKGALLDDGHGLLRSQGKNTQSALRLEFRSEEEIDPEIVADYVRQAIVVEEAGLEVEFKARRELELPEELRSALNADSRLAEAFRSLTPGRQRSHVLHIGGAKQAKTRAARVEKCAVKILAGKDFNER